MAVPKFDELFNPLLSALHELGSSAQISELEEKVAGILGLSEKDLNSIHEGNRTKFSYNLAWARTYLKRNGLIENSSRGVWALTPKGESVQTVDKEAIKRKIQEEDRSKRESKEQIEESAPDEMDWEMETLDAHQKDGAKRI